MPQATGLRVGKFTFKEVRNLKYLDANPSFINDNHGKIIKRVTPRSIRFFRVETAVQEIERTAIQTISKTSDNVSM